jgi:hypothetical protein
MDLTKIAALTAKAAELSNQTVAQKGGGDYVPPAAGECKLRFIGYVELGTHETEFKGVKKKKQKVALYFEVSGPNHPPREGEDGKKFPIILTIEETLSLNEKARFFKLFNKLNYQGKATHMAQLLGEPFLGEIFHRTYKRKDGTDGVAVELYNKAESSYAIRAPRRPVIDEDSGLAKAGEFKAIPVDAAITPLRIFLWDQADLEQWATIHIPGEYAAEEAKDGKPARAAKSKNVIQNKIMSSLSFKGSPINLQLLAKGVQLDIPDAESGRASLGDNQDEDGDPMGGTPAEAAAPKVLEGAAAADVLNGIA